MEGLIFGILRYLVFNPPSAVFVLSIRKLS